MRTIEAIRRARLQLLRKEFGSVAALNRKLGRLDRDATLGQLLNDTPGTKSGKIKAMGSPLARDIEEKLKLPVGWMDNDPDMVGSPWPFETLTPAQFAQASPEIRRAAEKMLLDSARDAGSSGELDALAA